MLSRPANVPLGAAYRLDNDLSGFSIQEDLPVAAINAVALNTLDFAALAIDMQGRRKS